ncbi:hypothetical protein C8Q74DRAFT_1215859 [Fomes fomentarius]|nr:hypothetical protein C8Q74DRAFT_1215859 [Fomes fomentarius]
MTFTDYTDSAGVAIEYLSLAANSYGRVASAAFVVYEYLITLDREIDLFWNARSRSIGATTLFVVNRYWSLVLRTANMFGFMPMPDQYIPWAVFAALRGFALSRSRPLSALIFVLSVATPIANIALYPLGFTGYYDPIFGCTVKDPGMPFSLSRIHVLLIIITWTTISRKEILETVSNRNSMSLAGVLLRNGTLYFLVLLALHCLHLTLSLFSVHVAFQSLSYGYATVFTEVFTSTLVSRFLLDLQEAHRKSSEGEFQLSGSFSGCSPSRIATLVFQQSTGTPITSDSNPEEGTYHEPRRSDSLDSIRDPVV